MVVRPSLRPAALVTAAWMAFVWATRVRNAVGDAELSSAELTTALVLAAAGLVGAGVLVVVGVRRRGTTAARIVAATQVAVWVWRGIAIPLAGHEVGFVVVHEVLAVVSIASSVWVWRAAGPIGTGRFRADADTPLRSRPLWDSPSR